MFRFHFTYKVFLLLDFTEEIVAFCGFTVTVTVLAADLYVEVGEAVIVIVAFPGPLIETVPAELTVATLALLDLYNRAPFPFVLLAPTLNALFPYVLV